MAAAAKSVSVNRRGVALLLTFMIIAILTILVASLALHISYQSRLTLMYYNSVCAFNNARSGMIRAQAELLKDPLWGSTTELTCEMGSGRYTVKVTPQTSPSGVSASYWRISSRGESGGAKRALTCWAVKKTSLEYVQWSAGQTHPELGVAWLSDGECFSGPVHSNGYFSMRGNPRFDSPITSGNTGDPFFNSSDGTYTQGGKKYCDNRYFYHYSTSYEKDAPVPIKKNDSAVLTGNGPVSAFPSFDTNWKSNATNVYNGTTTIAFLRNGHVRVTGSSGTVELPTASTAIYVNGDVNLRGNVNGKASIIADGDVHIKGNIRYRDNSTCFLGVISSKNIIFDNKKLQNVEFDGFFAALGGSFLVEDYAAGEPRGTLTVFGSILAKYGAPVNTCSNTTGVPTTGYVRNLIYDKKCLDAPSWYPRSSTITIYAFKDENVQVW
ncbi:MAG: hypothetical protein AB2L14_05185 [Candidatus Xenobiia bacterium LiM19]